MSVFLDTNVLLYAALREDDGALKRGVAQRLLDRDDCALSMQVLQEFVHQATHPRRTSRLPLEDAVEHIAVWRRFSVQETTLALFDEGLKLLDRYRFSFWDSMIVAAARAQGCEILYSEDMHDGQIIDGLRIVNPFR